MKEIFLKGGPIMWPLLICSLLSLTISIERGLYWWKVKREKEAHRAARIFGMVADNDGDCIDSSIEINGHRESMELAAEYEIESMSKGMDILDTIITMAPLLGILGTVLGIIDSFNMLANTGITDPVAATGGIAQALITTAAGLSVALVALIPFNYFIARVRQGTRELNRIIVRGQC